MVQGKYSVLLGCCDNQSLVFLCGGMIRHFNFFQNIDVLLCSLGPDMQHKPSHVLVILMLFIYSLPGNISNTSPVVFSFQRNSMEFHFYIIKYETLDFSSNSTGNVYANIGLHSPESTNNFSDFHTTIVHNVHLFYDLLFPPNIPF